MTPVLWLFGLPSSGKTTLARALRAHLAVSGKNVILLDGDELRMGICSDLGFSEADRGENLRRAAETAKLLAAQGFTVICAFITPKEVHRDLVRRILEDQARLIHVSCPLDVCIARDVKGLYAKAASRQMQGMTGTQDGFDLPAKYDVAVHTDVLALDECVRAVMEAVSGEQQGDGAVAATL